MKIFAIIVRTLSAEYPWIVYAWDEFSIDENLSRWSEALKKAKENHKDGEIGIGVIEVPDDFMDRVFDPLVVKGVPVEK
jgi:hypothetical protein